MPNYSHSKLETFDQCKLLYKFRYIDKIQPEFQTTIEAFMGNIIHQVLHKLYLNPNLTIKDLFYFYHQEWGKNFTNKILIVKNSELHYKSLGEKCIINYYYKFFPFTQSKTMALETQETIPLNDAISYHIRIDRLSQKENIFEIHDYKTNSTLKTYSQLIEDKQLAMYSIWIAHKYPQAKKIKLIWHFLAFNHDLEIEITEEKQQEVKQKILNKIKEVESTNDFPPNPSQLCSYCLFKLNCPEFKKNQNLLSLL